MMQGLHSKSERLPSLSAGVYGLPIIVNSVLASCSGPAAIEAAEVTIPRVDAAQPAGERSATTPAPREQLAHFYALDDPERERFCRQTAGYSAPEFERCTLESVGNGAGLVLRIVTACGGDSCDVVGWFLSPKLIEPFAIPNAEGHVEAAPDGSFLLVDEMRMVTGGSSLADRRIVTVRIGVPTRQASDFADCFSPKLSPKGRYIVCRDRRANVVRVPLEGGPPELIADVKLTPAVVEWVPYAYRYPDPVEFRSDDSFSFDVVYNDGAMFRRVVKWTE